MTIEIQVFLIFSIFPENIHSSEREKNRNPIFLPVTILFWKKYWKSLQEHSKFSQERINYIFN